MLGGVFDYYGYYGAATPGSVPFPVAVAGISDWVWVPAVGFLGTYLLLLFPDGRLPSRRWRPLAWLSGAVILLLSVCIMLSPGTLDNLAGVRNPFGIEGADWLAVVAFSLLPLLPLCMLASALSLVLRYRRSGGEERQQIKWIAFAASVVVVLYAIAMIASIAFPEESWTTAGSVWWLNLLTYAVLSSFTIVPIAEFREFLETTQHEPHAPCRGWVHAMRTGEVDEVALDAGQLRDRLRGQLVAGYVAVDPGPERRVRRTEEFLAALSD